MAAAEIPTKNYFGEPNMRFAKIKWQKLFAIYQIHAREKLKLLGIMVASWPVAHHGDCRKYSSCGGVPNGFGPIPAARSALLSHTILDMMNKSHIEQGE